MAVFAAEGTTVYLADGGSGDGSSAESALGSLTDAYAAIGNAGTIVISGEYTVAEAFISPAHSGKVTITSVYGGVDYRNTADAAFVLQANYYCGGETVIDGIKVVNAGEYKGIFANYKKMTIGEDVVCAYDETVTTVYPSIVAGTYNYVSGVSGEVDIYSGKWARIRLGNSSGSPKNTNVNLTIHGGECLELVYMSGAASHSGNMTLTVNGGTLWMGVFGTSMSSDEQTFSGNMNVIINGGDIRGRIRPQYTKYGTLEGNWNVVINGGDFSHCAEIIGTSYISDTMKSSVVYGENVDINKKETGTYTFTNPLRYYGADPWLFFHDGNYYYTATAGDRLSLYMAANIGDLSVAAGTIIYDPEDGHEWSHNMWSPEIHYFSAEEVGEEYAGWYCYVGSDEGDDANYSGQRAYVIKCLDGDNLMGRWGHPITGEVNVPQKVLFPDSDYNENELCGGCSKLIIDGKTYITFVSEVGRDTDNFYQTLNIVNMENPWTLVGQPTTIAVPTEDWEMNGSGLGSDGLYRPKTVECTTAVYGDDGSIYLAYAGSAYWTSYYSVGQIKYLGGDPMEASSWEKGTEPVFSKSDEITGSAHACFFKDTDGNRWACYHGYIPSSGNDGRYAFVEPYTVSEEGGLVIGDGTGHPAPLSTEYKVNVNPAPILSKIDGFTALNILSSSELLETTLYFGSMDGAVSYNIYRNGTIIGSSDTYSFVDGDVLCGVHEYQVAAVGEDGSEIYTATANVAGCGGLNYADVDGDKDVDLRDAFLLIDLKLSGVEGKATLVDVIRILKAI